MPGLTPHLFWCIFYSNERTRRSAASEKENSALFYKSDSGNEPVREWLKKLPKSDRQEIAKDIRKAEYGWPIGMPTCDSIEAGLWEIRTNLDQRIARVFFCVIEGSMLLLHGIIKKSQKPPKIDLDTARSRRKNAERRLGAKRKRIR